MRRMSRSLLRRMLRRFICLRFLRVLGILGTLFALSCAAVQNKEERVEPPTVRCVLPEERELPDQVSGFGNLSFLRKIEVAAPQDGMLERLYYREGDRLAAGAVVAILENPLVIMAASRALDEVAQARASLDLASARLAEGRNRAEALLLGLRKGESELAQARRELAEAERKQADQEALYAAGGLPEESVRSGRFALASGVERIALLEQELAIAEVGCRESDLRSAGYAPDLTGDARLSALLELATQPLRAERTQAQARLDAALKEADFAALAQAELTLRSPAAGIVGSRYVEVGERLRREDKILAIMDLSALYAHVPLPEQEALRVERGMPAVVRVDGVGGEFLGTVDLVAPAADSASLSFSVRVLLRGPVPTGTSSAGPSAGGPSPAGAPPSLKALKPGMFARVVLTLGAPRRALFVPETALRERNGESARVCLVQGGVVREREVRLGQALGALREIKEGLDGGELVVDAPRGSLREGEYVSIAE
jgi:multidrug efflux pump subunit AcrA (membrane-fusion protein)